MLQSRVFLIFSLSLSLLSSPKRVLFEKKDFQRFHRNFLLSEFSDMFLVNSQSFFPFMIFHVYIILQKKNAERRSRAPGSLRRTGPAGLPHGTNANRTSRTSRTNGNKRQQTATVVTSSTIFYNILQYGKQSIQFYTVLLFIVTSSTVFLQFYISTRTYLMFGSCGKATVATTYRQHGNMATFQ